MRPHAMGCGRGTGGAHHAYALRTHICSHALHAVVIRKWTAQSPDPARPSFAPQALDQGGGSGGDGGDAHHICERGTHRSGYARVHKGDGRKHAYYLSTSVQ